MPCNATTTKLTVAIAALSIVGTTSSASAIVTQNSDVVILANGFDVGGATYANDEPTSPAVLEWDQGWWGVLPTLRGSIHFRRVAGSCARVKLVSYDDASVQLGVDLGVEECVFGDGYAERPFELRAQPGAARVEVILQTLAANDTWGSVGNHVTVDYGPTLGVDQIAIRDGEEFVLAGGVYEDDATVTWTVPSGNSISPILNGTMYARRADDRCGRIKVEYFSGVLGLLDTRVSVEHCLTDDALHTFPMVFNTYSTAAVDEARYTLESRTPGGNWSTVGQVTAYLP